MVKAHRLIGKTQKKLNPSGRGKSKAPFKKYEYARQNRHNPR